MPAHLASLLSPLDLPPVELRALVLDGEAYPVGECVAAIDEPPSAAARAATIHLPPRLIAEQHTAAWVWGAASEPPARHEVCADITARARPAFDARLCVREVVLLHEDFVTIGDLAVTTPMRTAIDLARFVAEWSDVETATLRRLLELGSCTVLDCARVMNRKRNLPGKKIALERLSACVVGP